MIRSSATRSILVMLATALFPAARAAAQVGSGWQAATPGKTVQTRGCGAYMAGTGVETFGLTCTATDGDNRAEARVQDDYTSGTHQFQGEVRVVSLAGTNVSLKQTFMRDNGAWFMLGVASDSGGRLYSVGDANADVATGALGRWVRINTVHDVAAGTLELYVDGVLRYKKTGGRQVAFYDKYGSYRLHSGHGQISVEWRNLRFWTGGKGDGTQPAAIDGGAPAVDGGAPADAAGPSDSDAGEDPDPTPDAAPTAGTGGASGGSGSGGGGSGSGGAVGGGGAGGSGGGGSGSGGGAGTGGHAGASAGGTGGGSPGEDEGSDTGAPPSKTQRGGGCAFAGSGPTDGVLGLACVALLVARRRRAATAGRRRR